MGTFLLWFHGDTFNVVQQNKNGLCRTDWIANPTVEFEWELCAVSIEPF
jgi:hypothetical protein